jgi:hypothetical protein
MRLAPIEKLAHLERKLLVLRRERAAVGKFGKRRYFFCEFPKPAQARVTGLPLQKPVQDDV